MNVGKNLELSGKCREKIKAKNAFRIKQSSFKVSFKKKSSSSLVIRTTR